MISKIREVINGNGKIKGVVVVAVISIFTWLVVNVRDLPASYVKRSEIVDIKNEIAGERSRDIGSLEKFIDDKFNLLGSKTVDMYNLAENYVCKEEFREARKEIRENREKEIKVLEKIIDKEFRSIERSICKQEEKLDALTSIIINKERK